MHNHVRMYVAGLVCNIGKCDWKQGAKWMHYHLLDADWASNYLSWQWVAGTSRNRQYIANQENVNKYCRTKQTGTFLDFDYPILAKRTVPSELATLKSVSTPVNFPEAKPLLLDSTLPVAVYTPYNLDPVWRSEQPMNRVLLLEPSLLELLPMADNTIRFVVDLASNINGIQVFHGEFAELLEKAHKTDMYFKEHPLTRHFTGNEDSRDWMLTCEGPLRSFFSYWNRCKQEL